VKKNQDVAAKTDVTLGGATITPQGSWIGKCKKVKADESITATFRWNLFLQ